MRGFVVLVIVAPTLLAACMAPTGEDPCADVPDEDGNVTPRNGTSQFTLDPAGPTVTPGTNLSMLLRFVNEDCGPFEYREMPTICGGSAWQIAGDAFVVQARWNRPDPDVYVPFSHSCGAAINAPIATVAPGATYEQEIRWDGGIPMHVVRDGVPVDVRSEERVWLAAGSWPLRFGSSGSWDGSGETSLSVESTAINRDSPLSPSACDVLAYRPDAADDRRWTNVTIEANRTEAPRGTPVRFWVNLTLNTEEPGCYLLAGDLGLRARAQDEAFDRYCGPEVCGIGPGDAILILADDASVGVRLEFDWAGPDAAGMFGLRAQFGVLTQSVDDQPPPATLEWT